MNPEPLILFGAGGHSKSVISVLEQEGRWQLAGLLEDDARPEGRSVLGYSVLGSRAAWGDLLARGLHRAHVAIGNNEARASIAEQMEQAGFTLVSCMHPSSRLLRDSHLGQGSFLHAYALVGAECRIGRNAIVQPHVTVGHECVVGDHVQFCPGVHIGGQARIGDLCFFGPGAVVFPKVKIGRNVAIGANSVVRKDVPDNTTLVGNPARLIRREPAPRS